VTAKAAAAARPAERTRTYSNFTAAATPLLYACKLVKGVCRVPHVLPNTQKNCQAAKSLYSCDRLSLLA